MPLDMAALVAAALAAQVMQIQPRAKLAASVAAVLLGH
jgi:hypothetical protein